MAGKRSHNKSKASAGSATPSQAAIEGTPSGTDAQSDDLALPGFLSIFQEMVTPGSSSAGSKVVFGSLIALFFLIPFLYFSGFPLIHVVFISFFSLGLFASFIWFMSELDKEKARASLEGPDISVDPKKTQ